MMINKSNSGIKLFIIGCLFILIPLVSGAKDYDYYVDGSVSKNGDGSESKPFKTIDEAVEKGGDIFVENGKYNENIELKKSTRIYGESKGGVVISGKIIMDGDTRLQDITARGVKTVISVKSGADVEIENCTIRDFGKIGIEAVSGSGKLKVVNSKVINGDGKGLYIQRGKTIELLDNEVTDNDEEGIDIRSKVRGTVKNNLITRNGESGIELIVGSADLQIEDNVIKRNGASGIATQFYPDSGLNGKGQVNINNNSIGENKKYGLDCNIPQGGVPGVSYWRDSIEMAGNNIYANQIRAINDYCNFIDAVDEDEKSDNVIEDSGYGEDNTGNGEEPELTAEEKKQIEMEEDVEKQAKEQKLKEVESLLDQQELSDTSIEENIQKLENESKIKIFFLGVSRSKVDGLILKTEEKKQQLEQVRLLIEEINLETEEEISLQETLNDAENVISRQRELLEDRKNSFSILGWLKSLFQR